MKIIEQWKEKTPFMKVISVIGIFVSVAVIVLATLQITGVMEDAGNYYMPGLAVLMFIQAIDNWKKNRGTAYISLFVGLFILAIVIYHFATLRY